MHTPEQARNDAKWARRRARKRRSADDGTNVADLEDRLAEYADECARLKEELTRMKREWLQTGDHVSTIRARELTALLAETQPGGEPGEETGT